MIFVQIESVYSPRLQFAKPNMSSPIQQIDARPKSVFTVADQTKALQPASSPNGQPILAAIFHLKAERRKLRAKLESNQCQINFLESKLAPAEKCSSNDMFDDAEDAASDAVHGGGETVAATAAAAALINNVDDRNLLLADQLKCVLQELTFEIKGFREILLVKHDDVKSGRSTATDKRCSSRANNVEQQTAAAAAAAAVPASECEEVLHVEQLDSAGTEKLSSHEIENGLEQTATPIDDSHLHDDMSTLIKNIEVIKDEIHAKCSENCLLRTENCQLQSELSGALQMCKDEMTKGETWRRELECKQVKLAQMVEELENLSKERDSLRGRCDKMADEKVKTEREFNAMTREINEANNTLQSEIEQLKFELTEWNVKQADENDKRKKSLDNIHIKLDYLSNCMEHTQKCADGLKQSISSL